MSNQGAIDKAASTGGSGGLTSSGCVFCEIVDSAPVGPSDDWPDAVVYADEIVVAFLDRAPLFPGHTLVVPRRHVVTIADLSLEEIGPYFARVQLLSKAMPLAMGKPGVFVANNNIVSQSVPHLHFHVVPRQRKDGLRGFFWPRTRYADGELVEVADLLRVAATEILDSGDGLDP